MNDTRRQSILILDDDLQMGRYLEIALSRIGYDSTVLRAPVEIQDLGPHKGALVDVRLAGGASGLDFAFQLMEVGVPVALMTGLASNAPAVRAGKSAGIDLILHKPFPLSELKTVVEAMISRSERKGHRGEQ